MHEMSIVSGVIDAVVPSAEQAGATRVLAITLRIGDMTEVVDEALEFFKKFSLMIVLYAEHKLNKCIFFTCSDK